MGHRERAAGRVDLLDAELLPMMARVPALSAFEDVVSGAFQRLVAAAKDTVRELEQEYKLKLEACKQGDKHTVTARLRSQTVLLRRCRLMVVITEGLIPYTRRDLYWTSGTRPKQGSLLTMEKHRRSLALSCAHCTIGVRNARQIGENSSG